MKEIPNMILSLSSPARLVGIVKQIFAGVFRDGTSLKPAPAQRSTNVNGKQRTIHNADVTRQAAPQLTTCIHH